MPRKKTNKDGQKITKYLIKGKSTTENLDPKYIELQEQVEEMEVHLRALQAERDKLIELHKLPETIPVEELPTINSNLTYTDVNTRLISKKIQLKCHEWAGQVVSSLTDTHIYFTFHGYAGNDSKYYYIKLNNIGTTEEPLYAFDSCFVPPSIRIQEMLKLYPLRRPRKLIHAVERNIQVFHNIKSQLESLQEATVKKNVKIFHTCSYEYIEISLRMYHSSNGQLYEVRVGLCYKMDTPRPHDVILTSSGMSVSYLEQLKKQFRYFKRYKLLNAFDVATGQDLKSNDSVFCWLNDSETELTLEASNMRTMKSIQETNLQMSE